MLQITPVNLCCFKRLLKVLSFLFSLLFLNNGFSQVTQDNINAIIDEAIPLIHLSNSERLKEINTQLDAYWDTSGQNLQDSIKAKYFNYKGSLAIQRWEAHEAITYYEKAISYSTSDDDFFRYYLGMGVAYQILDQFDESEKYMLKSLDHARLTGAPKNEIKSLFDLANLYRESGNAVLEIKYTDLCLTLNPNYIDCQLLKANYNVLYGKLEEGLKELWEVVIQDPEFMNIQTIYALMTLVHNYIEASGIDKAEKLIKLILKNKDQLHEGILSSLTLKQGLIYKKRGMLAKAHETFMEAQKLNSKSDFQNKIWLEIYLLDEDKTKYSDLLALDTSIPMDEAVIKGTTGDFIRMVTSIQNSSKLMDLNTAIKKFEEKKKNGSFQLNPRKLLLLYEEIKKSAKAFKGYNTYFVYAKKLDSIAALKLKKEKNVTNHFLNAQLFYYENQILNRDAILNETEIAFLKEKKANRAYSIYLISALISFLLILILFIQTTLQKRKNQKLLSKIAKKNEELVTYTNEYENMLLILSHHVKKPINQLYYSFKSLKDKIELNTDKKVNFLVNTISDSTSELSNRIAIVLTLLKIRMNKTENIAIEKVNLNELINERISNFQILNFQLNFDKKSNYYVFVNRESLCIIIDNALENVKKYNETGTYPEIMISQKNEEITLGIKNKTKEKTSNVMDTNTPRDSFGLGQKIIRRLCEELKINFEILHQNNYYSLLFTFRK